MKSWTVREELNDLDSALLSAYSQLARHLLFYRDIKTNDEAEIFLNPKYDRDLYDPFLILNMDRAVERILRAVKADEKIVIYADYDCDGIPGAVILHDTFKKLGFKNFSVYIPHRYEEGYGLNIPAVEKFVRDGVKLLITVDTGITDNAAVARASELGIDVIITDHHLPLMNNGEEVLPPAFVILNSKQSADKYPFRMLSGAGVAFKLAQAILRKRGVIGGYEKWLLDMVGISTIADMVPLTGENRALASFGLKVLRRTPRIGLQKLFYKTGIEPEFLTEDDIGFLIGPRINSASRMGVPQNAFQLLSSTDHKEVGALADYLEERNAERKCAVADIMCEVEKNIGENCESDIIVVGDRKWKPGVVGLVASRIMEKWRRPAFVWGSEGTTGINGSCRSDGTVDMVELMTCAGEELFLRFGGHALSGGFSVREEKLSEFGEMMKKALGKIPKICEPKEEILEIDRKISLDELDWELFDIVNKLAPFGMGNPKPIFLFENLEIDSVMKFGKTKNHLKINFKKTDGKIIPAIMFFADENSFSGVKISAGEKINLAAHLDKGTFKGYPELRLRIVDIKNSDE